MDQEEDKKEEENEDSEDNLPSDSSNDRNDVSDNIESSNTESLRYHSSNGHAPKSRHTSNYIRFSNPQRAQEWKEYDFGTSYSTASEMSLYQSALDLQDMNKLDPRGSDTILLSNTEILEGIAEETSANTIVPTTMVSNAEDLYFRDGLRRIDFVLAYETTDSSNWETFSEIRKIFETNLMEDGLQLEHECEGDKVVQFVKIHAPWEVMTRYAEIMKLKMPMKLLAESVLEALNVADHFPDVGLDKKLTGAEAFVDDVKSAFQCCTKWFSYDTNLFPPQDHRFTFQYSREKEYLFDIPINRDEFFTPSQRSLVVEFILKRTNFSQGKMNDFSIGIIKLVAEKVYTAAYPLHEGQICEAIGIDNPRGLLKAEWGSLKNIFKMQPVDHIRNYLGIKCGLYFAWLGFYTYMLLPASIVGIICFLYGILTVNTYIPSQDICNNTGNITMCPVCDNYCDYWQLKDICVHSKFSYFFDNPATIVFAVFMSFWSALFLELWKRYSATITHRWDLTGFDPGQQQPRPQYLAKLAKKKKQKIIDLYNRNEEPKVSYWKWKLPALVVSCSVVLLMISVAIAALVAVIFYRMSVMTMVSLQYDRDDRDYVNTIAPILTTVPAAIINLCCILILNQMYGRLAELLTELEMHRTQSEYDDSLTLKMFLLQFVNYYASIFYVAFFKGKLVGPPDNYNRLFGRYRQEECGPGGCLIELSIQLSIIMVGKQALNSVVETIMPKLIQVYKKIKSRISDNHHYKPRTSWERDYNLLPWSSQSLFWEYLEMVLQFGFVTIFVAAFPLAPLFALLNNMFEMRLDANKILVYHRRPVANRVKDIGVWYRILDALGKLSVVSNALIIAFTSNFIPRMVYLYTVSEDGTLTGFLEHSLSHFNVSDYPNEYKPEHTEYDVDICRYEDYRKPPTSINKYNYSQYHWHVLAARLAFVVVFENFVVLTVTLIRWLIPDMPQAVKEKMLQETYIINELIVAHEASRAKGEFLRTNPRLIRFNTDIMCDRVRNHLPKNNVRKRPNSESIV